MELIELKCPRCGGDFERGGELDEYECPYCGCRVTADMDAAKLGVKSAFGLLSRRQELNAERKRLELEAAERDAEKRRRGSWLAIAALLLVAVGCFAFVAVAGDEGDGGAGPGAASVGADAQERQSPASAAAGHAAEPGQDADSGEAAQAATDADGYRIIEDGEQLKSLSYGEKVTITGTATLYSEAKGVAPAVTYHGSDYVLWVGGAYIGSVTPESLELLNQCESSAWEFRETLTVRGAYKADLESSEPLYGGHDGFVGVILQDGAEIAAVGP